jgi:hypothetical protein
MGAGHLVWEVSGTLDGGRWQGRLSKAPSMVVLASIVDFMG